MLIILSVSLLFYIGFIFIPPIYQLLISLAMACGLFDLVPETIIGFRMWDIGILLFFTTFAKTLLIKKSSDKKKFFYEKLLLIMLAFFIIVFLWSILIYGYPIVASVKSGRFMIIGISTYFIYSLVFKKYGISKFLRVIYIALYILLLLAVAQYFSGLDLLKGLEREFEDKLRYIPIFLIISSVFFWSHLYQFISKEKVKFHQLLYIVLYCTVLLLTFGRALYFVHFLILPLFFFIAVKKREIHLLKSYIFCFFALLTFGIFLFSGALDSFIERAATGVSIITNEDSASANGQHDTFSGRLDLLNSRVKTIMKKNMLLGYGFIHDEVARKRYKHLLTYNPKKQESMLYLADNGWATIFLLTGLVGAFLYTLLFISVFISYFTNQSKNNFFPVRLGFFLAFNTYVILTINNSVFYGELQLPMYLLAGYTYLTEKA